MPNFLKPILALVISILIFAGYIYLADAHLLDFVQTRFYNPAVINSYVKENSLDAQITQDHISALQENFSQILKEPAVRSSFLYNQSAEDIYQRSRIFGILLESTAGLQYVQFVDSNGLRIHFSTLTRDIISQSSGSTAYRNYNEDRLSLPYEALSVPSGTPSRFTMDEQNDRIIFSYPFYDAMDIHRGTAFFYVSIRSIAERLIAEGRLKISDGISVIASPAGILLGSPEVSKADILGKVSEIWNEGNREQLKQRVTFDAEDSAVSFSLISLKTDSGLFFGRLINDSLFFISEPMKLILKLSMFLTFFLALFFLLNIKPNPVTLVRNRIKHLRDNLFEKLYVNKSGQERIRWILELEQRRDEIRKELKRKLKLRPRQEAVINGIIDKSWDELLSVLKSGSGQTAANIVTAEAKLPKQTEIDEIEPLEEIGEAEAIEEIGEAEEIDEVEALEEIGETEEIDEVEALEEIGEAEEIEEAEALEEIDEVEEIGEAEALEEIIEEAEALEEISDDIIAEEENIIDTALREALETDKTHKGLLQRASEFIAQKGKGLLALASRKVPARGQGLLKRASSVRPASSRGLLARGTLLQEASRQMAAEVRKANEAAIHSALLSVHEYNEYFKNEDGGDLFDDFDIVSPSSMFSSLKK